MKILGLITFLLVCSFAGLSQPGLDSLKTIELKPVVISTPSEPMVGFLKPINGTYLVHGKKNELVELSDQMLGTYEKSGRQVFAKIPGVFVYDMDGHGNQINISTRGLDPHRGWEFNTRKDGVITNSDMFGYPASHFSLPLEAVQRIEFVRGTGSLQYGAQFGGMLNFIGKSADTTKRVGVEQISSVGSYKLASTYTAVSGRIGQVDYYAFFYSKTREGYRENEQGSSNAQSVRIIYRPNSKLKICVDWSRSCYLYQTPGPLSDSMFQEDPRQSTRFRNYFSPDIHIPSVSLFWKPGSATRVSWISSAVLGLRNSVLFDKNALIPDSVSSLTNSYASRQVDIDRFKSFTHEVRVLQKSVLFDKDNTLLLGVQFMHNDLHRRQQGIGTTQIDYDLSLINSEFGRNLHLKSQNLAIFFEDNQSITSKLSVNVGARWEVGHSNLTGKIAYYPEEAVPVRLERNFLLLGGGLLYNMSRRSELYSSFSQSYRPVVLKDLVPASVYETVDPELTYASGYNFEVGFRGNSKKLRWDISVFSLSYNNRFGTLTVEDTAGLYILRTNLGDSRTNGIELFAEWKAKWNQLSMELFTSTSFMDGRYLNGSARSENLNVPLEGNRIESVPSAISRNGLKLSHASISVQLLYSITSSSYSDPLNTMTPSITGAVGVVPGYSTFDAGFAWNINPNCTFRIQLNNVLNESYFTKRPSFYPGPGIWPADGRNFSTSLRILI